MAVAFAATAAVITLKLILAATAFFQMEEVMLLRQHALFAISRFIDDEERWPNSWQELGPYVDKDVREAVRERVHVDFDFDTEAGDVLEAVSGDEVSLPDSHHFGIVDRIRRQLKNAAMKG